MAVHTFLKNAKQCQAKTAKGTRCNSYAVGPDFRFCFIHSPLTAAKAAQARSRGGRNNTTPHGNSVVPTKVRTIEEVLDLLDYTLSELVLMTNSILRSRALIALSETYLKAISVGEFEARLAKLEGASNAQP